MMRAVTDTENDYRELVTLISDYNGFHQVPGPASDLFRNQERGTEETEHRSLGVQLDATALSLGN